ncbi:MAG: hypothetical protein LBI42_09260 [Chitinispirillales bacterium]|nr:hypothetical protein [Chitinispirillales bacterium]
MGKTILTCVLITAFAFTALGGESRKDDFARFFAGVAMLRADRTLNPEYAAVLYRELLVICNVTTSEAVEFLERSKSDPLKWREFNELVITVLTEQFEAK